MNLRSFLIPAAFCAAFSHNALAAEADLLQCAAKADDAARLKCYDALAASARRPASVPPAAVSEAAQAHVNPATAQSTEIPSAPAETESNHQERTYLTRAWNLDGRAREGGTQLTPLRPYRTSYLIARKSTRVNTQPSSPAPGHATPVPLDLDSMEAKFQFSFKAEIMNYRHISLLGFDDFRLWGAYTQQSNWQAFNARNSAPFRETNYEPELIATFGTGNQSGFRMLNVGLVHQSNGKSATDSRSWNRAYLQGGWEWDNGLSVLARGWWRIPENAANDDNPDIQSYVGRADAVIRWEPDKTQSVSLLLRNNLNFGKNRGFMQFDWTTPLFVGKSAKFYTQVTSGFGESLIDYNHRQTTFGMGVSFREW
ncbi:phospholipase [Ferrigenium kumadai]|uniref:Phospholipase A1 n=1 Tax=Ferrigenium kumadai TaxID=1682490 RepID=A0AAN1SX51_9PROT|nr:phospholipase A [Ferrigenium kumadai]BBI98453.1 phospholipase [Ferrigenium kumadai]